MIAAGAVGFKVWAALNTAPAGGGNQPTPTPEFAGVTDRVNTQPLKLAD